MTQPTKNWQLWTDTGGTFTDCIGLSDDGSGARVKVLSHGALRGRVSGIVNEKCIAANFRWPADQDIFKGYFFKILSPSAAYKPIEKIDLAKKIIYFSEAVDMNAVEGADFELTAHEEAPVLAARLITGTSLDQPLPIRGMRLGSTRGTNALLERKGAKTLLLITRGFKDLLLIGNQQRPDIFSLEIRKSPPFYQQVLEVDERIAANGEVIVPLSDHHADSLVKQLDQWPIESIAIAFLNSYRNPVHENLMAQKLRSAGWQEFSLSHQLAPEIKLLPRAETCLINAYLSPVINNYLSGVRQKIGNQPLKVMTSAGGLVDSKFFTPKDSLYSGPAGGVVGAARMAERSGLSKIIVFDMGGTSTDVSRFDGNYDYRFETKVGDAQILSPSLAIDTVAAGGGSICFYDGFKFAVGPESAGANPGPACYGAGGPLTITDVNLLLGRLVHDKFGIPIDPDYAEQALEKILAPHQSLKNKNKEEILAGFLSIANENMAEAIRNISVGRGFDIQQYALLAFGGAGGQHACEVAQLLGMTQIAIPYDAGLLSAWGMGQARVERFAIMQVLKPFKFSWPEVKQLSQKVSQEAIASLIQEGYYRNQVEVKFVYFYLRFKGQDSALEIPFTGSNDLSEQFRERYRALFGHWIEGQTLELESVKAIAATKLQIEPTVEATISFFNPPPSAYQPAYFNGWTDTPVYNWDELQPGAAIHGPAIITSQTNTITLYPAWRLFLDQHLTAVLNLENRIDTAMEKPEEIQLALFTNRFKAIAEEMGSLLQRTAFSVNIKERLDFSCALLDERGELVVNAPHIPVHLGSLGICVRTVMEKLDMQEGDVVITNHPAYGGSHLPDITLICPVFYQESLLGFLANRAHHAEIGGKRPGSMPPDAKALAEEGVVISPRYLARQGRYDWDMVKELLQNGPFPSRSLAENLADLNAGVAALNYGRKTLIEHAATYGLTQVQHYMNRLKEYSHWLISQSFSRVNGVFEAEEFLDDGARLAVKITVKQDQATIDFSGSAPEHPGNFNATPAIVYSAVIYVLRLLINQVNQDKKNMEGSIPLNEGILKPVHIEIPGGMLNPLFDPDPSQCPAVVGGNTETSQRLVDTLIKALGLAACSQGTMNNLLFGHDQFGYYETIAGGTGAGPGFHGASGVHQHMTNTRITDPEILEHRYPVRLLSFELREHSGGKGKWQGGDGIIRKIQFLAPMELTILTQHRKVAPYGLEGGETGKPGRQFIIKNNGLILNLQEKDAYSVDENDIIVMHTPGGGGFGRIN
ncbi:MAG: hydantoinase B/oxoprolinase family protein [Candidatus Cyclobacteriaceae bacterium M3_2C_046]